MATNQTEHYQLNQWEATDLVQRVDFNADNQKLDSALHALEVGKAEETALTALSNTVAQNAKKESDDVTALSQAHAADAAALSQTHATDVAALREENRLVLLNQWSFDTAQTVISLPLGGNVGSCTRLYLYLNMKPVGDSDIYCTMNDITGSSGYGGDTLADYGCRLGAFSGLACAGSIELFPAGMNCFVCGLGRMQNFTTYGDHKDNSSVFYRKSLSFDALTSIQFSMKSGSGFGAGSTFTLYGLR